MLQIAALISTFKSRQFWESDFGGFGADLGGFGRIFTCLNPPQIRHKSATNSPQK
jgi:hypothetical protein